MSARQLARIRVSNLWASGVRPNRRDRWRLRLRPLKPILRRLP